MLHFLIGLLVLGVLLSFPAGRILVLCAVVLGVIFIGLVLNASWHENAAREAQRAADVRFYAAHPPPPPHVAHGGECFSNLPLQPLPEGAVPWIPRDAPCDPTAHPIINDARALELAAYWNWLAPAARSQWVNSLDATDKAYWNSYVWAHGYHIADQWFVPVVPRRY